LYGDKELQFTTLAKKMYYRNHVVEDHSIKICEDHKQILAFLKLRISI